MKTIRIGQHDLWRLKGPTNESATPPVPIDTPDSVWGRLYDARKDSHVAPWQGKLNAAAEAGATSLELVSVERIIDSGVDTVFIALDDGSLHESVVSIADYGAATLTIATPLASAAAKGRMVTRPLHAPTVQQIEVDVDARMYDIGDQVEITEDDGTLLVANVTNRARGYIEIDTGLLVGASAGRRISRKIGPDIDMSTLWGATPAVNTDDWGFQGIIPDDHSPDLKAGMSIRGEVTLTDSDTDNSILIDEIKATVV